MQPWCKKGAKGIVMVGTQTCNKVNFLAIAVGVLEKHTRHHLSPAENAVVQLFFVTVKGKAGACCIGVPGVDDKRLIQCICIIRKLFGIIIAHSEKRTKPVKAELLLNAQAGCRPVAGDEAGFQKRLEALGIDFYAVAIVFVPGFVGIIGTLPALSAFLHGFDAELRLKMIAVVIPSVEEVELGVDGLVEKAIVVVIVRFAIPAHVPQ